MPFMDFKFVKIEAFIKPFKLAAVRDAIRTLKGEGVAVNGMTVFDGCVKGFARQNGHTEIYRGSEYTVDFVNKVKIEIVAPVEHAAAIKKAIIETARTGKIGDGIVFMTPVLGITRIRTGEEDEAFFAQTFV